MKASSKVGSRPMSSKASSRPMSSKAQSSARPPTHGGTPAISPIPKASNGVDIQFQRGNPVDILYASPAISGINPISNIMQENSGEWGEGTLLGDISAGELLKAIGVDGSPGCRVEADSEIADCAGAGVGSAGAGV